MRKFERGGSRIAFVFALTWTIYCSCCAPTPAFGQVTNYALAFDASQAQSVSIPHLAAQDGYPFTVMCWFMEPTNSASNGAFVGNYVSSSFNGWQLASSGGQLYAWYYRANGDDVGRTTAGTVDDGLWHHAAFVVNSSGGVIYLDGVPQQTNAWTGTAGACTTPANIYLGIYQGDSFLTGDLDEVSVWNVALTAAQIQTYMHQTLHGTEAGLVDYYQMNEGAGTNIYDSTINADTGTFPPAPNAPTWILSGAQLEAAPQVATLPAMVSGNSAVLSGIVNPEGENTDCWFRWGLTTNYGNVTATNTIVAGYSISTNTIMLSNVSAGTYHFQIVASNVDGTNYGADLSFTVTGPPQVATLPATVNGNSAVLNGTVNPEGLNSGSWFNWGLSTNYGNVTTTSTFAAGYTNLNNAKTLSGLFAGTYHFQIVATNASGTNYGADQGFTINEQFQLGTSNLLVGPAVGTNSVILASSAANATWTVTPNASWLHVPSPYPSSGVGSANIIFSFDANTNATRSGTISIADLTLTVTQAGTNYVAVPEPAILVAQTYAYGAPVDVAMDSAGNAYVSGAGGVFEWVKGNNTLRTLVSGNYFANGIAVDRKGNVYFSNSESNTISEWVAASGQVVTLVSAGLNEPTGVAMDSTGNVYFADSENNAIREWVAANSNVVTLVSSGLASPGGVAVDSAGNVYIADTFHGLIDKWSPTAGMTTLPGFNPGNYEPGNLAVDGSGNVLFANFYDGTIREWSPVTETVNAAVTNGISFSYGAAVDSAGNIFVADVESEALKELPHAFLNPSARAEPFAADSDALPTVLPTDALQFLPFGGPTSDRSWLSNVGVVNGVTYFTFTANDTGLPRAAHISLLNESITINQSAIILGTTNLLEGPAAGTDSVMLVVPPPSVSLSTTVEGGWLHPAAVYQPGANGTNAIFTYDANPGPTRTGTIFIGNGGVGQTITVTQAGAPYAAAPAPLTTLASGLDFNGGVAVDNAGNVYIGGGFYGGGLQEWVAANNSVITLNPDVHAGGLAMDTVDNLLFISDGANGTLYVCGLPNPRLIPLVTSGLSSPGNIALDGLDNVYIADFGDETIKRWNIDDGSISVLITNVSPGGMTVDNAGDVYISGGSVSGTNNSGVLEWIAATGNLATRIPTVGAYSTSVAVDGSGNIYIGFTGGVEKWTATTGNLSSIVSGTFYTGDVYVDNNRDLYMANGGEVWELPRAFVDPAPRMEGYPGGSDALQPILPANVNLQPPFAPVTDQPWLTVTDAADGIVDFAFTSNIGPLSPRTGHVNVLGESVTVIQTNAPVTPPNLTGAQLLGNGSFQFTFTNTAGTTFTVLATTNLALPLTNWVDLGTVSNSSSGIYQFTSQPSTNAQEFYQVVWP